MIAKVLTLILVAVLYTVQSAAAKPVSPENKPDIFTEDWIFHIISEFTRRVDTTSTLEYLYGILADVQNRLKELSSRLQTAVTDGYTQLQTVVEQQIDRWTSKIQDIVKQAADTGVDVQDCLDHIDNLKEIFLEVSKNGTDCLDQQVQIAKDAIQEVSMLVPDAENLLNSTVDLIQNCTTNNYFQMGFCFMLIMPEIGIQAAELVQNIALNTGQAVAAIASIAPMTGVCTSLAFGEKTIEVNATINESVSCIKDKLNMTKLN